MSQGGETRVAGYRCPVSEVTEDRGIEHRFTAAGWIVFSATGGACVSGLVYRSIRRDAGRFPRFPARQGFVQRGVQGAGRNHFEITRGTHRTQGLVSRVVAAVL